MKLKNTLLFLFAMLFLASCNKDVIIEPIVEPGEEAPYELIINGIIGDDAPQTKVHTIEANNNYEGGETVMWKEDDTIEIHFYNATTDAYVTSCQFMIDRSYTSMTYCLQRLNLCTTSQQPPCLLRVHIT